MGQSAYKMNDFYHCLNWMQAAFQKKVHDDLRGSSTSGSISLPTIMEYHAFALHHQNNKLRSFEMVQKLIEIGENYL
jgi:hypothetical protein